MGLKRDYDLDVYKKRNFTGLSLNIPLKVGVYGSIVLQNYNPSHDRLVVVTFVTVIPYVADISCFPICCLIILTVPVQWLFAEVGMQERYRHHSQVEFCMISTEYDCRVQIGLTGSAVSRDHTYQHYSR